MVLGQKEPDSQAQSMSFMIKILLLVVVEVVGICLSREIIPAKE